jgi:hypothetical protein
VLFCSSNKFSNFFQQILSITLGKKFGIIIGGGFSAHDIRQKIPITRILCGYVIPFYQFKEKDGASSCLLATRPKNLAVRASFALIAAWMASAEATVYLFLDSPGNSNVCFAAVSQSSACSRW